jgi:hypothetical protein
VTKRTERDVVDKISEIKTPHQTINDMWRALRTDCENLLDYTDTFTVDFLDGFGLVERLCRIMEETKASRN